MSVRIVSIQHGDYREALDIVGSNVAEPYFGMRYSVETLEKLIDDNPSLVISLDAPNYDERRGNSEVVGMARPRLPRPIPRRVAEFLLTKRILKRIEEFRPTHVLIRTGIPSIVEQILRLSRRQGYQVLVVFANFMPDDCPRQRRFNQANISLMNEPFVFRVGNHRWPATRSLIDAGLDPAKAIAWDTPGQRQADDYAVKDLAPTPFRIAYIGSISAAKGVGDLIDAAAILHSRGIDFRLSLIGAGDELPAMRQRAAVLPEGMVEFKGRLANHAAFEAMRDATLVVVPSRHSFAEGLPYTITEALASRTPLLVSDHPVMIRAFQDGEGLRFFEAANPSSLANIVQAVLADPTEYRRLSITTAHAQRRVDCPDSFGDLLDLWKQQFPESQSFPLSPLEVASTS